MTFPFDVNAKFVFIFTFSVFICSLSFPAPLTRPKQTSSNRNLSNEVCLQHFRIVIEFYNVIQILALAAAIFTLLRLWYTNLCKSVRFVSFNTNLNLLNRKVFEPPRQCILSCFWAILLGLLLIECNKDQILILIIIANLNLWCVVKFIVKFRKMILWFLYGLWFYCLFSVAFTPAGHLLCLMSFQIRCLSSIKRIPTWLPFVLIKLSNDIHVNPGPHYQNSFFNFMNWNLNSLAKDDFQRVQLIEAHNSLFNYDLISICETGLNDSVELPEVLLDDYKFVSANNPANTRHGGVGLFYKDSLPATVRNDLSFDESIVLEIKFGQKRIFFTVIYRSPSSGHNSPEFQTFLSNFKNLYSKIKAENPFATFFSGDFNAHSQFWWPDGNTTPEGSELEDTLTSLGLSQMISEPTNFEPNKSPSCIDLIITDQPNIILDCGTRSSLDPFCHHQIIYGKINFRIAPPPPFERKIWHFDRANTAAIKNSMSSFPWHQHLNLNPDSNWQVKTFTDIFLNIMSNFIPNELKRVLPRNPPWITKHLKGLLNKKNRLYKNYKKHGYKAEDKVRLNAFRIECKQKVEAAKLSYLQKLGEKVNSPNTTQKSYWKIINRVMNRCRTPRIPPIIVNNLFIINIKEKTKYFNDFFSKQCRPITNSSVLPAFNFLTEKRIDNIAIENDEIISLIRKINPSKAAGSDGISGQMLLICDNSVILPLKIIFSNIMATSTYPDLWKLANVTPVFKKGDKQLIKNYRPISLLPICGKILEKIIFNNLYSYLNTNKLITKNQSGFRPGDSTTNQLLCLVDEIHQAFDNYDSLEVRAVFLDISKAFDKVWHDGLIFKLEQNGISGNLLKLFHNYLKDRKQRVVLNGSFSDYSSIGSGVPQGSVLGPLLFLIYINDLEKNIKSNVKFFADDTMLYSIVKDPELTASDLNQDLHTIQQWAHQWKLEFNPDPTKQATEVQFSCKTSTINHPQLTFNACVVPKVNEHKHLGLILDPGLSFEKHIIEKIIKAKKSVGIIKHLSRFLPLKTLDQMYKALVRSHLDYCDIIYHLPSTYNQFGMILSSLMDKVERVQYQAALAVTGTWQGSSRLKLYEELGWESLSDRRWCRRMLHLHKILDNKTPCYLKDKLPRFRRPLYVQNNCITFHEKRCRTERHKGSFFPAATNSWNKIITYFNNNIPTIGSFKNHILSLIRPVAKSVFGIHDPKGIHNLFQLRVGLSSLKYHKRQHNFENTLSDQCLCNLGTEDIDHFFFICPFYVSHRATLAATVVVILQKYNLSDLGNQSHLYLYGHRSITFSDNKTILLSTIKYINDTKRFTSY